MNKAWILVALTGSVATAVACSSSSSPPATTPTDDAGSSSGAATDDGGGSSSGATPDAASIMVTCKSAADCSSMGTGFICCGTYTPPLTIGTVCQMADCTPITSPLGTMPAQGCAVDSECRGAGYTCQTNVALAAISPGAKTCLPPAGDGGATDSGATTDSGTTTDAGPVDAATGG
jgi:hypothetical protein